MNTPEKNILNSDEVNSTLPSPASLIPHRYPFLLIDRVLELVPGTCGLGLKQITSAEALISCPTGNPMMPGALIVEALAQMTGIVLRSGATPCLPAKSASQLVQIPTFRFRHPAYAGDTLELRSTIIRKRGKLFIAEVRAECDGKILAEGRLSIFGQTNH